MKRQGACPGCNVPTRYEFDPTCTDCQASHWVVRTTRPDKPFKERIFGPWETELEALAWCARNVTDGQPFEALKVSSRWEA